MRSRARTAEQIEHLREIEAASQHVLDIQHGLHELEEQQRVLAERQVELDARMAEAVDEQWARIIAADQVGLSVRTLASAASLPLSTFHRQLKARQDQAANRGE